MSKSETPYQFLLSTLQETHRAKTRFVDEYRLWLKAVNRVDRGLGLENFTWSEKRRVWALNSCIHTIYFVASVADGLIKIGRTTDIEKRMAGLCNMSPTPLQLVAAVKYHPYLERLIHDHLSDYRAHGEWFYADKPVIEFLREVKRGGIEWVIAELGLEDRDDIDGWTNIQRKNMTEEMKCEQRYG